MKTWITIPTSELPNVDWSETLMTNANSVPRNITGDTALVKWKGDMPSSIANISNKGLELDYENALALLETAEWRPEELI